MKEKEGKENEKLTLSEYEVRGIFDVGYYDYDAMFIVTSLEDAQELYVLGDSVHGLLVVLKDPYQAPAAAEELSRTLGSKYDITTWMEENGNLLGALVVEKNMMFFLLFFIMIVAALCILSALITFVVQKTREIGMLKALGGPFPDHVFCPTGGVTRANAGEYLALPNVLCVGGSWITPAAALATEDWAMIESLARDAAVLRS